ncbi:nucleotidyltransferase family protein [Compostibacter hankyongensis]|uniref:Nucleotidyltransferase family protein n=1 Tax=Compostibacter hankyongensis TaxID=1007089 RepID=A0ABP8FPX5_9BACT
MTSTAIVLAGGLGTRLRGVVNDLPKCLAPVAGRPFLYYVLRQLRAQGIRKVILSLGHRHEQVTEWCRQHGQGLSLQYVIEPEPLGTGGAIRYALEYAGENDVFVLNGDTYFPVDLGKMYALHHEKQALVTLALKPMRAFSRYGSVQADAEQRITGFAEKQFVENGLINGGIYLLQREKLLGLSLPEKFSFENEFLVPGTGQYPFFGYTEDAYFIDIGVPEDYERAQREMKEV